jgi:uncharacterized membrane protein YoaK (UPF0700 family)
MNTRLRGPLIRIAAMWVVLGIAFVVGLSAHSVGAFVAIMAVGLVAGIVLRVVWR